MFSINGTAPFPADHSWGRQTVPECPGITVRWISAESNTKRRSRRIAGLLTIRTLSFRLSPPFSIPLGSLLRSKGSSSNEIPVCLEPFLHCDYISSHFPGHLLQVCTPRWITAQASKLFSQQDTLLATVRKKPKHLYIYRKRFVKKTRQKIEKCSKVAPFHSYITDWFFKIISYNFPH